MTSLFETVIKYRIHLPKYFEISQSDLKISSSNPEIEKMLFDISREIEDRIKFADTKAGIILSATGIIIGIGMAQIFNKECPFFTFMPVILLYFAGSFITIILFVIAIYPSKRENNVESYI